MKVERRRTRPRPEPGLFRIHVDMTYTKRSMKEIIARLTG
jgi:hypothetical protein